MRRVDALLTEDGKCQQNPTNKRMHRICVQVIFVCVMAPICAIPPIARHNLLSVVAVGVLICYAILSPRLALGYVVVLVVGYLIVLILAGVVALPIWAMALVPFVLAWLGQLWEHKVEGKKPSFFQWLPISSHRPRVAFDLPLQAGQAFLIGLGALSLSKWTDWVTLMRNGAKIPVGGKSIWRWP